MNLEDIGFYTLSDRRAEGVTASSSLQRCELILTSRCNFLCPYCRGMKDEDKGDLPFADAVQIVSEWGRHKLKNIRFSGGEPTLYKHLPELIALAKTVGIERIAVSSNGSADFDTYAALVASGANDFSISLDSCCVATGNKMAGGLPVFDKVISTIKALVKLTYVTVGVVLTEENQGELNDIISFAMTLGVADIRIIPAAQIRKRHEGICMSQDLGDYPILNYRVQNYLAGRSVRGLTEGDNSQCPLVLDDMAIMNGKHYPCIIYLREHGPAIGTTNKNMECIRNERADWFSQHNCHEDQICVNNCLDVCVAYNNKVRRLNRNLY